MSAGVQTGILCIEICFHFPVSECHEDYYGLVSNTVGICSWKMWAATNNYFLLLFNLWKTDLLFNKRLKQAYGDQNMRHFFAINHIWRFVGVWGFHEVILFDRQLDVSPPNWRFVLFRLKFRLHMNRYFSSLFFKDFFFCFHIYWKVSTIKEKNKNKKWETTRRENYMHCYLTSEYNLFVMLVNLPLNRQQEQETKQLQRPD